MYSFFLYQSLSQEDKLRGIWETTCSILHKYWNPEQIGAVYYLFKHLESEQTKGELKALKPEIARIVCQVCDELSRQERTTGRPRTMDDPGEPGEPWFALPFPLMENVRKRLNLVGLDDNELGRLGILDLVKPVQLLTFPQSADKYFSYALVNTKKATNKELLPLCVTRDLRDDEELPWTENALKWSMTTQSDTFLTTRLYVMFMIMYGNRFSGISLIRQAARGNPKLLLIKLLMDL